MECKSTTFFQTGKIIFTTKVHRTVFQRAKLLKIFFYDTFVGAFGE